MTKGERDPSKGARRETGSKPGKRAGKRGPASPPPRLGRWEPRKAPEIPEPDVDFIQRCAPPFRFLKDYCRVTVDGLENVPREGAVIAANHTGWLGLDYSNLFLALYDHDGRVLRAAVHPTFFRLPGLRAFAKKVGLFEVGVSASTRILDAGGLITYFPEAEDGNFKPVSERYQLQGFKPGFARAALAAEKPIIPAVIVGGEEANPSLARIDVTKDLLGVALPVPVNVWPFPVKWRIKFMEPVDPQKYLEDGSAVDEDVPARIARDVRAMMQDELGTQLELRGSPWV